MKDELDIYTTLEEAKEEIWRRWNDKELRKKVEEYLGQSMIDVFKREPMIVLFRNVITPDIESSYFIKMAKLIGLTPIGLEYVKDRFCTRNSDKLALGKLAFFEKRNKNGEAIIYYKKIIDIKENDNKRICDIEMENGKNLVDFHHDWLKKNEQKLLKLYDMSDWIDTNGHSAKEYYKKFLVFFICHGVLFENFILNGEENKFTLETFLPAYKLVFEYFGVKPLIISAMPKESFGDKYWWCYPKDSIESVNKKI